MIDDSEQEIFEATRQEVADVISLMPEAGAHPALVSAGMMSIISEAIMTEDFWGAETPGFIDLCGFWNLMWMLRETAFADLAASITTRNNLFDSLTEVA